MVELSREALIALAIECGANDAGAISIDSAEMTGDRPHILSAFARARSVIPFVVRMNVEGDWLRLGLNYLVPFCVSAFSGARATRITEE